MNMANAKDNAMKTNRKKTTPTETTIQWLTTVGRDGRRRIEKLGWKRLAGIYLASAPASAVRKAIQREARRCGYTTKTIIALHAE